VVTDRSCDVDFRRRISIRRLSFVSTGIPEIAKVSSVFTS
jgi:hypothetical protein